MRSARVASVDRHFLFSGRVSLNALPAALALTLVAAVWPAVASAQAITEFPVTTVASSPREITTGPDGNLWFTEEDGNNLGQMTTAGVVTEFPVPTASSRPGGITVGPDSNLWFTEIDGNKFATSTTAGVITEFPLPAFPGGPRDIAVGSDGNLWFSE